MKREDRYVVIKRSDALHLNDYALEQLSDLESRVAGIRASNGKAPLRTVVVESDWPEYEKVWGLIEARVDGTLTNEQKLRKALVGLIGSDDREELLKMRAFVEAYVPGEDKVMALGGINALLETLP